jgi:hypothetical protein
MISDDRGFADRVGLCAVAGCQSVSRAGDIVFVHGLGGGSHSSWIFYKSIRRFLNESLANTAKPESQTPDLIPAYNAIS